ncbi:MAG: hypothetical protein HND51_16285 [Chloroflexi bacterium]|nr:hypothetical protein [Chloroflexota bacterium]
MKKSHSQFKALGLYLAETLVTGILVAAFFYLSLLVYRMAIAPLDLFLY